MQMTHLLFLDVGDDSLEIYILTKTPKTNKKQSKKKKENKQLKTNNMKEKIR
jgi:hypothetical protein